MIPNRFRGLVALALGLAMLAVPPAFAADNYAVRDGNGGLLTMAGKLVGSILHPFHIGEGIDSSTGAPTPQVIDHTTGGANVNIVGGSISATTSFPQGAGSAFQPDSYAPTTIAPTTTQARTTVLGSGPVVMVKNDGAVAERCAVGNSSVAATSSFGYPIAVNETQPFYFPGGSAYVSCITTSGTGSASAWSGTTSEVALMTLLNGYANSPAPAQTSHGVLQGAVEGQTPSGVTPTENPIYNGCRAATTIPVAVADGQKVAQMCSAGGKTVMEPFVPEDLRRRGQASATSTTAQAFTGWATPATGKSAFITHVTCHREDAGTTPIHATLNDSASTVIPLPAGSGSTQDFAVPLKVSATATAPTFTMSSAVTTAYCSAQGYEG